MEKGNVYKELAKILSEMQINGESKTNRKIGMMKTNFEKNGVNVQPDLNKIARRLLNEK